MTQDPLRPTGIALGYSDLPTMHRTPMFRQLDAHLSALQELLGGDLCLQRSLGLNNSSRGFLLVLSGSSMPAPGDFGAVPCLSGAMAQKNRTFSAGVRYKRMLHRGLGVLVGWESGGTCRGPCSLVSQRRVKMLSTSWLKMLLPFQSAGRKLETILCFGSKPG